eukprot:7278638-Pyramimonas_sp.AAC.1
MFWRSRTSLRGGVVRRLALVHAGDAVGAGVARVGRGDPDVERREPVPQRPREHVRGPQAGAWDE